MFAPRYDATKLKLNLKLAQTRLQNLQKKNENQGILARKEIAKLLDKGKEELARIKVEQVIRDDYLIEAMELMEMYCSLLITRFGLIDSVMYCDEGIREAVCTIIWATPRMQADITEFKAISTYLTARYRKEFADDALQNRSYVNERVIHKLSVHQPEARIVDGYLRNIAQTYKVNWNPPEPELDLEATPNIPAGLDAFPSAPVSTRPPVMNEELPYPDKGNNGFAYPPPAAATTMYPPDNRYQAYPPPASQPPPQAMYPPPQQPQEPYHPMGEPPSYRTDPFPTPQNTAQPPQFPTAPTSLPTLPAFPTSPNQPTSDVPDFDELTRRFQNLRKN